jgi:hypothetical protein
MLHRSSDPEQKAPDDEPEFESTVPKRPKLALGTILVLNLAAALIAWAVGLAVMRVGQAMLHG